MWNPYRKHPVFPLKVHCDLQKKTYDNKQYNTHPEIPPNRPITDSPKIFTCNLEIAILIPLTQMALPFITSKIWAP